MNSQTPVDLSPEALMKRIKEDTLTLEMPEDNDMRRIWLANHIQDSIRRLTNKIDPDDKLRTIDLVRAANLVMCTLLVATTPDKVVLRMATIMCLDDIVENVDVLVNNPDCVIKVSVKKGE